MAAQDAHPEKIDWNRARHMMALLQFQERYLSEVRAAVIGERLAYDNHETTGKIRAVIAEICDRDRLVIPKGYLGSLVQNFILALDSEEPT
jgi:hypothetical protein